MAQQWKVRISGEQRKEVDVSLLIQAVIALGRQLRSEARQRATLDGQVAEGTGDGP